MLSVALCNLTAMPRKDFVDTLRSVAAAHGLEFQALSHDWIIQIVDPVTGRTCSVFGYTFDINPAGAVDICREKAATSLVLDSRGVENIPHKVFLSPCRPFAADYVPRSGNWQSIQKLVQEWGLPLVLKPLKGTGGLGVERCSNQREVEAAVQRLHSEEYGLAVSPYKRVIDEYRCFHLDGVIELIYRKVRSSVRGDGTSTVAGLVGQQLIASPASAAAAVAHAASELSAEDLARVPAAGESVPLQWKHNLGQGASADLAVPAETKEKLGALSLRAAKAIGIRFCSVDVVDVEGEGLMVMEVNSGVMMDSLMGQLGDEGIQLARRLYESAVLRSLGRS